MSETTPILPQPNNNKNKKNNNNNDGDDDDVAYELLLPAYSSPSSGCIQQWIQDFCASNSFLIKAVLAIGLANLYPPLGATYLHPEITATWWAVIFIFAMAGLSLKSDEFANAATRGWFNTFVLSFNFFVVSLLVFGMTLVMRYINLVPKGLTDGMVVCACMPITVSMVIVLTKSANGDEAAAVLLAAVGSLAGVFLSPTLILLYIGVQSQISMSAVFVKLLLRIVVPIMTGQLLQLYSTTVVEFVERHKTKFRACQEWALIYIVYTVFCKTFSTPLEASIVDIVWMAIAQCTALILSMIVAWYSLKILFRDEPRLRVTGLYGCTQKSVAMGIPLIGAVYENDPRAGLFTLPLLIWHPAQLLIGSGLAPKLAKGVEEMERHLARAENDIGGGRRRRSFFSRATSSSVRRASSVAFESPWELALELEMEEEEEEEVSDVFESAT